MGPRGANNLRDHVARALNDDDVPFADLLAVDVLFVVQRGPRDGDPADLDRLQHRPGIERARTPDADRDLVQPRRRSHRGPLESARPARTLVERAETRLLFERIDLDHDSVDLVVELGSSLLPLVAGLYYLFDRFEPFRIRVGAKAVLAEPLERLPVRRSSEAVAPADAVDPDRERTSRGDRRVLLAQGARRRIARVRSSRLALRSQPLVELAEA